MSKKTEETWCRKHPTDEKLPQLLEKIDTEMAEEVRGKGCRFCGSTLHRGDYPRKPRGVAVGEKRLSWCCSGRDCRRRHTPPSVRFLGRRVYAGFVVVLLSAMRHGLNAERIERIRQVLGVDARTLERWRQWWLESFAGSAFWKAARARFTPPLDEARLPWSLCVRYEVERRDRLLDLLRFLAPITVSAPLEKEVL